MNDHACAAVTALAFPEEGVLTFKWKCTILLIFKSLLLMAYIMCACYNNPRPWESWDKKLKAFKTSSRLHYTWDPVPQKNAQPKAAEGKIHRRRAVLGLGAHHSWVFIEHLLCVKCFATCPEVLVRTKSPVWVEEEQCLGEYVRSVAAPCGSLHDYQKHWVNIVKWPKAT